MKIVALGLLSAAIVVGFAGCGGSDTPGIAGNAAGMGSGVGGSATISPSKTTGGTPSAIGGGGKAASSGGAPVVGVGSGGAANASGGGTAMMNTGGRMGMMNACPRRAPADGAACTAVTPCLYAASTCTCTAGSFVCTAATNCPATAPTAGTTCAGLDGLFCLGAGMTNNTGGATGAAGAAGAAATGGQSMMMRPSGCFCSRDTQTWTCFP